jgi:transposase-like protein
MLKLHDFSRKLDWSCSVLSGVILKKEIILMLVRWYLGYSLSYREMEELALDRGLQVDHSTINRWVIKYSPQLE